KLDDAPQMGGIGEVVQIDESIFRGKRKYHRGRLLLGDSNVNNVNNANNNNNDNNVNISSSSTDESDVDNGSTQEARNRNY
ncbi:unnamed protein product, partial [Rotaria sordida]